jgi:hypothetical protein
MTTLYMLYVLVGGGALQTAWGGPAIVTFATRTECESAAAAIRPKIHVIHAECIAVTSYPQPKDVR